MIVRTATSADHAQIAELTVAAYRGDGQTHEGHSYEPVLADVAGRSSSGEILVCTLDDAIVGAVLFVLPGSKYAELSREGEAEFRMLAVSPAAQRRGVGEALVRACLERAKGLGCKGIVICVRDFSMDAQRLYARLGFYRDPSIDWTPMEGVTLLGLRHDL